MVSELQLRHRVRLQALALVSLAVAFGVPAAAVADQASAQRYLADAQSLYQSGQYFKAARYAFAAIDEDEASRPAAYSWITVGLSQAGLHNSASYFFIRTLQSENTPAIRRVLSRTQDLMTHVGADLLRKYLIRHTKYEDYDSPNRSAYLFALGKEALLSGQPDKAIGYLNGIPSGSAIRPLALQLRGTAHALLNRSEQAIGDFEECRSRATAAAVKSRGEAEDLEARCTAGKARTLYQMDQFNEADRTYDQIAKGSMVWPDILFEQAWNSFGKQEYNRSLGKLVTYKSPALSFVHNSESDVLRAQSFLALCLYSEANAVINEFNSKYTKLGESTKRFVEANRNNIPAFYEAGKQALHGSVYGKSEFNRMANRFVRSPYFQNLVANERELAREASAVSRFDASQQGVGHNPGRGFPGFLNQVLKWRSKSIKLLGGTYVKNSLLDHHNALISDFEKMAFIKLEMLKRAKEKLIFKKPSASERGWGNVEPTRRNDQFYWSFNGEFWNDELGDYVFGLESECNQGSS